MLSRFLHRRNLLFYVKNRYIPKQWLLGELHIDDSNIDTSTLGTQFGAGYRFDFVGTTCIDEMKDERVKSKEIYDLLGRKVENPTSGIYIICGKKVVVK